MNHRTNHGLLAGSLVARERSKTYAGTNLVDQFGSLCEVTRIGVGFGLDEDDVGKAALVDVVVARTQLVHECIVGCRIVVAPSARFEVNGLVETDLVAFALKVADKVARGSHPLCPGEVVVGVLEAASEHPRCPCAGTHAPMQLEDTLRRVALHAVTIVEAPQGLVVGFEGQSCGTDHLVGIFDDLGVILRRTFGIDLGEVSLGHGLGHDGTVVLRKFRSILGTELEVGDDLCIRLLGSVLGWEVGGIDLFDIFGGDGLGDGGDDGERAPFTGHVEHHDGAEDATLRLQLVVFGLGDLSVVEQLVQTIDQDVRLCDILEETGPVAAQYRIAGIDGIRLVRLHLGTRGTGVGIVGM